MTSYPPIPAMPRTAIWFKPGRGIYFALATLAMASGTIVLVEPAPYDFALILMLAAAVLLNRLTFDDSQMPPVLLLSCFVVANLFSMLNVQDPRTAIEYNAVTANLILTFVFFIGFAGYYGLAGVRALLLGYVVAGWLVAGLSTLAFFRLIPFSEIFLRFQRAQGLFKDPNVFGPYMVSVLIFTVAALQWSRMTSLRFAIGMVICAITCTAILLSFSRAAWINTAVSLAFMLALQLLYGLLRRRITAGLLYTFLALGLFTVLGGLAAVSLPQITTRLLTVRQGDQGLQNYGRDRFDTQRRALEAVREQPLGIGAGQSEIVFQYSTPGMYVRILAEAGVFGFVTFYAFIGLSFVQATQKALTLSHEVARGISAATSACILGILINGLVIDTIHWRHLWFLLGLAWCLPAAYRQPAGAEDGE